MGYSRLLAHYPYLVVAGVALFSLTCLVVVLTVGDTPAFSDPKLGFVARGTELSGRLQSYSKLLDETNGMLAAPLADQHFISAADLGTQRDYAMRNRTQASTTSENRGRHGKTNPAAKPEVHNYTEMTNAVFNETEQQQPFFCDSPRSEFARYTFQHVNKSSMFTLVSIQASCQLDRNIRALPGFHNACFQPRNTTQCCRSWSLGNYIALLSNHTSCEEIKSNDVTYVRKLLEDCAPYHDQGLLTKCSASDYRRHRLDKCADVPVECLQHDAVYHIFHHITDMNFLSKSDNGRNSHLTYTMTFIPLASGIDTKSLYHQMEKNMNLVNEPVEIIAVNFGLKDALFDHYLQVDSMYFIGAVLTVICIMWLYTQSIFLTFMAIMSIFISLLISYCLYSAVYEIAFFPYMNLMAVVLLIGIGADDVFLYCRIWYLAKLEKNIGTLEKVVSDTLRHAALSMFVTSFTTAAALLANLVSNITALKCFSIFASTTIVVNFAMMLTWIPASIVIHDKWGADCCFCYDPQFYTDKGAYYYVYKMPYKMYNALREWARIFFEKLLPYIVIKLRFVWLFVLGVIGVGGVFVVLYYPKLKLPSTSEFQVFALTHPFEVYDFKIKSKFWFEKAAGNSAATVPLTVVWGVKPRDTGNKLDPYSETTLDFDTTFNFATVDAQKSFLRLCRGLRSSPWYQPSFGPSLTNCFIEPFMKFMEGPCVGGPDRNELYHPCCRASQFPYTEDVFRTCLQKWVSAVERSKNLYYMNTQAGPRYAKDSNDIVALVVEFSSKQPYSFNYEEINEFYKSMNDWINDYMSRAPPEFKHAWFVSDLGFYDLQSSIAHGTPIAIGVSIAIATVVAFMTTLNVLITLWAMVSISATVFVVVAILVLIGWELNIMEAVTLTVAVGLAMDFTLHYGMGYRLSPDVEREMRVLCSMRRICSPVAMAALSTFLAGAFVLPSTIQAYRQLGIFLVIVMSVSWVYSTFFFMSLLTTVGPIGGFSQFSWPSCDCCSGQPRERVDKTVYTMSESNLSSSSTNHVHTSTSETHELEPLTEVHECEIEVYQHPKRHGKTPSKLKKPKSNESIHKHSTLPNGKNIFHEMLKKHRSIESEETYKSLLSTETSPSGTASNANVPNNQLMNNIHTGSIHVLSDVGKCDRADLKQNGDPVWVRRSDYVQHSSVC